MAVALLRSGLIGVLLIRGGMPLEAQTASPIGAPPIPYTPNVITITWNASPSPEVTGYRVCWGTSPAAVTNRLDVGDITTARLTLIRQQTNATYYFAVVAYDATGDESGPSNTIQYFVSPVRFALRARKPLVRITPPVLPPELPAFTVNANAGDVFELEATTNFQNWEVIFTTNCPVAGAVTITPPYSAGVPQRFFRVRRQ
jgi:hypothetical protein